MKLRFVGGLIISSLLLVVDYVVDQMPVEAPDGMTRLEALDRLARTPSSPPQLSVSDVFIWGLKQRSRSMGIFGRQIPVNPSLINSSSLPEITPQRALMYRGHEHTRVSWRLLEDPSQLGEGVETDPPQRFEDLSTRLIVIEYEAQIHPDSVTEALGMTRRERRVYETWPPYALRSLETRLEHPHLPLSLERYQGGEWTLQSGDQISKQPHRGAVETLITQILPVRSLHVGGSYQVPYMSSGSASLLEVKVIDRRFERRLGSWLEIVELETVGVHREHRERWIRSTQESHLRGDLEAHRLSPTLISVPRSRRQLRARAPLPISEAPLEFEQLHQIRIDLPRAEVEQGLTAVDLKRCSTPPLPPLPSQWSLQLRLNFSAQGSLDAASATHQSAWPLTRCLLSQLSTLKVSSTPITQALDDLNRRFDQPLNRPFASPMASHRWESP